MARQQVFVLVRCACSQKGLYVICKHCFLLNVVLRMPKLGHLHRSSPVLPPDLYPCSTPSQAQLLTSLLA